MYSPLLFFYHSFLFPRDEEWQNLQSNRGDLKRIIFEIYHIYMFKNFSKKKKKKKNGWNYFVILSFFSRGNIER